MLVPIDPPPVPTPAVVVAYSPIVCALARGASIAITAISIAAGSNIFLRLISIPLGVGLLRITVDTLIVASQMRQ